MSTTVSYKGNTLTTVNNATKTLETEGKYLEANIILTDVSQAAPVLETVTKTYTPTESQQTETITPGVGNDGIAEVDVTVGAISSSYVGTAIDRRDSTDLSASGATVSVPSGYYENNASKSVASGSLVAEISGTDDEPSISVSNTGLISVQGGYSGTVHPISTSGFIDSSATTELEIAISGTSQLSTQSATTITPSSSVQTAVAAGKYTTGAVTVAAMPSGTAGTPIATKGTVSNHSVTVTPSVTNTTGYITGSTKTGTAVTVSASELVSGSETKTANGTYDVTNLAELVVNVSGGGGSSGTQIAYDQVHPDASTGYLTFGVEDEPTSFVLIALNDISTGSPSRAAAVVGDGTNIIGQTITNTSNAQVSYTSGAFQASYDSNDKLFTIYASGVDFQPINYGLLYSYGGNAASIGTADVQVGSGATSITFTGLEDEPIYWSCLFKSNFSSSSGYQRVIAVASDDTGSIIGLEMDSGAHSTGHWTSSYSNGSLTITSNGTNQGGYFHQPGYYQLTYAVGEASPYQKKSVTYTPTTAQQTATITADTGYDALSQVNVTVNAMPTMTLPSSASATSSGTSKATITPGSSVQYLNIPTGYNATAQYYTIGASGGGGSLTVATKTLTNTAVSQTLSFTSLSGQPKYWFLRCTSNVSSSGSTTYYYVTDAFYDGTSVKGNTFRIGSTRRVQNVTSGISQSYSGNTLTITAGSSSGATPGQFYGASGIGYELVYIY